MALPIWLTGQSSKAFTAAIGAAISYGAAVVTTGGYPALAEQPAAWWIGGAFFVLLTFLGTFKIANVPPAVTVFVPAPRPPNETGSIG